MIVPRGHRHRGRFDSRGPADEVRPQRRQGVYHEALQELRAEAILLRSMMEPQFAELFERQDFADKLLAQRCDHGASAGARRQV
jgi:hypothetical protein